MDRIYHPYWKWEDYKLGFYNNCNSKDKKDLKEKVVELFSNPDKTKHQMNRVVEEWLYSCEHNLTNPSMNKIAYIGQAACCLGLGIPSTVTMEAWREVPVGFQDKANEIAKAVLNNWINNNKNKQLCLKLD